MTNSQPTSIDKQPESLSDRLRRMASLTDELGVPLKNDTVGVYPSTLRLAAETIDLLQNDIDELQQRQDDEFLEMAIKQLEDAIHNGPRESMLNPGVPSLATASITVGALQDAVNQLQRLRRPTQYDLPFTMSQIAQAIAEEMHLQLHDVELAPPTHHPQMPSAERVAWLTAAMAVVGRIVLPLIEGKTPDRLT